jgi:tryptophan-rich sensory protein
MMKLLVSIAICEAAGIIGSFFTVSSVNTWYKTLVKPDFTPPAWIFAPMWTTLYLMMGVSLFLVWRKRRPLLVRVPACAYRRMAIRILRAQVPDIGAFYNSNIMGGYINDNP